MLSSLPTRLLQTVVLGILAAETAYATFGCSTQPKVQSGQKCGIDWDRGGGGGGSKSGGDKGGGNRGGGGDVGWEQPKEGYQSGGGGGETGGGGNWGAGGNGKGRKGKGGGESFMSIPPSETPELPPKDVEGGTPPAPTSTNTVGGGPPTPFSSTPVLGPPPSQTESLSPDVPEEEETETVGGGSPPTSVVTPPTSALAGSHSGSESATSALAGSHSGSESETNLSNESKTMNNTTNTEDVDITNSITNLEEWKSTEITLMITIDYERVEVANIAANVDISAQAGHYEVPQAPWLTCAGESFYYRFTSSAGTVEYTEEFVIEGKDKDLTKSCVEDKAKPTVTESPKGLRWQAINNQTFGYTIIQNVTNIINQVVTTVVNGESITKTVTAEGATVTADAPTVSKLVTVTDVVTEGGETITSIITSAVPTVSPDAISPNALSPDALSPTGVVSPGAAEPTATSGTGTGTNAGDGSGGTTEDDDDEWDDAGLDDSSPSGTASMSSGSASATSTPGAGSDDFDDWDGFGAANGRPQVSIALAIITSMFAMLAGGCLMALQ